MAGLLYFKVRGVSRERQRGARLVAEGRPCCLPLGLGWWSQASKLPQEGMRRCRESLGRTDPGEPCLSPPRSKGRPPRQCQECRALVLPADVCSGPSRVLGGKAGPLSLGRPCPCTSRACREDPFLTSHRPHRQPPGPLPHPVSSGTLGTQLESAPPFAPSTICQHPGPEWPAGPSSLRRRRLSPPEARALLKGDPAGRPPSGPGPGPILGPMFSPRPQVSYPSPP